MVEWDVGRTSAIKNSLWGIHPDFSNNTFLYNDAALLGHSVYILGDEYDAVSMVGDRLDVFSTEYNSASLYWVESGYGIDYYNTEVIDIISKYRPGLSSIASLVFRDEEKYLIYEDPNKNNDDKPKDNPFSIVK